MADCDMCGKKGVSTVTVMVEGVDMTVCPSCAKYGERKADHSKQFSRNVSSDRKRRRFKSNPDEDKILVPDFSARIKKARESKGLKQEQLADRINEKESLLHKFESGSMHPSFKIARKLERFFSITLIESASQEEFEPESIGGDDKDSGSAQGLTMGDVLKQAMEEKKRK